MTWFIKLRINAIISNSVPMLNLNLYNILIIQIYSFKIIKWVFKEFLNIFKGFNFILLLNSNKGFNGSSNFFFNSIFYLINISIKVSFNILIFLSSKLKVVNAILL